MRPVEKDDLPEINSWYRERGEPGLEADLMPPQGFIVPGVAAGFLIKTTVGIAFIEGFITNPNARQEFRREALHQLSQALMKAAFMGNTRRVFVLTNNNKIKHLADKYGFKCLEGHSIFGKDR